MECPAVKPPARMYSLTDVDRLLGKERQTVGLAIHLDAINVRDSQKVWNLLRTKFTSQMWIIGNIQLHRNLSVLYTAVEPVLKTTKQLSRAMKNTWSLKRLPRKLRDAGVTVGNLNLENLIGCFHGEKTPLQDVAQTLANSIRDLGKAFLRNHNPHGHASGSSLRARLPRLKKDIYLFVSRRVRLPSPVVQAL